MNDLIEKTVSDYIANNLRSGDFLVEKGVEEIATAHPEWDKDAIRRSFQWHLLTLF